MEQKKFKLIKHESNNYGYIVDENDVYIQVHDKAIQYIESLQKELDETKLELLKEKENHEIDLQNWSNDLKELEPMYNENEKLKNEIEGLDIKVEFLKNENRELKEEISSGCKTLKEVNRRLMEQHNAQVDYIKELEEQCTRYQTELMNRDPALNTDISKMETTTPEWISANDRLPEERIDVLFIEEDGCIHIGEMWKAKNEVYWYGRGEPCCNYVTHWMPLPPPPTTKEK